MGRTFFQSNVDFFNSIAPKWDSWEDPDTLNVKLDAGLRRFGINPDERILDVGCGTGNLTAALLRHLSASGHVTAVDLAEEMIRIARCKITDPRVEWVVGAVERMGKPKKSYDRIFCCSVWPHLHDGAKVAALLYKLCKQDGTFHLWHLISREAVNKIHREASAAVRDHLLPPASQTAELLIKAGFHIGETQDDENGYLITARKVQTGL